MIFNNKSPVYAQIIDIIIQDILNGVYKCGERLPSIRDLAFSYTVNQNTVLHSYKELERKNIIFTKRGLGYFVSEDENLIAQIREEKLDNLVKDFMKNMYDLEYTKEEILDHIKEAD